MSKPVILTGLRANNDLQLGNYFGALLPMIDIARGKSDQYQVNLFIPDLHSITTPIDYSDLQKQIFDNIRVFLAAGFPVDKPDVHIYRQSYISAHSELTWILDCFAGFGEMSRMTQFKDKSDGNRDRVSMGLFNYPVLMAADILIHNATYVPVGDDQSQHLEFTRDIAERMNAKFGELFTVPEPVNKQHEFFGKDQGLRIKDLVDPSKKMSKSAESDKGVIFLNDTPEVAKKKVMSATTDSENKVNYDHDRQPGLSNLIDIFALLDQSSPDQIVSKYESANYGEFKAALAEKTARFLSEFQQKLAKISDEDIKDALLKGELAVGPIAEATLLRVQKAAGLR